MHHQRQNGVSFGRDQHVIAQQAKTRRVGAAIGGKFRLDQPHKAGRAPVPGGDVVMRCGQRSDAPADDRSKSGDAQRFGLRLCHQRADQAKNIAHPVVEFGDQQILLFGGTGAFTGEVGAHPQHHFDQRAAQAGGDFAIIRAPFSAVAAHGFLPRGKAGARLEQISGRSGSLGRIARPANHPVKRAAPQHQGIARPA